MLNPGATHRFKIAVMAGVFALCGATFVMPGAERAAFADEAPIRAGTLLVARGDFELQKVVITRGSKVQVTSATNKTADVVLPDGYVLRRIALNRIRYFFEVVQ